MFVQLTNWVSSIGLDEGLPLLTQKKIRLLNQILVIVLTFVLYFFIFSFVFHSGLGAPYLIFLLLVIVGILYLQYRKRYWWVAFLVAILSPLFIMATVMLYGRAVLLEPYYLLLIIAAFFFLPEKKQQLLMAAWTILTYLLGMLYTYYFDSLFASNVTSRGQIFIFLSASVACVLVLLSFIRENRLHEQKSKELRHSLERNNIRLGKMNEELERYVYIFSHDLKTPIRNVVSFLDLLENELGEEERTAVLEYLAFARRGALKIDSVVEDLKTYAQMEKKDDKQTELKLNDLIAEIKLGLQSKLEQSNGQIKVTSLPNIYANKVQMRSLFQNLIENGLKYNRSSAPLIELGWKKGDNSFQIFVKDNGIGIATENYSKVFEMLGRLHHKDEFEGSGIGLALCKKIVEEHEGNIHIKSIVGTGSTFWIEFPLYMLK